MNLAYGVMRILLVLNRNQEAAKWANRIISNIHAPMLMRFNAIFGLLPIAQETPAPQSYAEYEEILWLIRGVLGADKDGSIRNFYAPLGSPDRPFASYCYIAANRFEDALADFHEILKHEPGNALALEGMNILLSQRSAKAKRKQAREVLNAIASACMGAAQEAYTAGGNLEGNFLER